MTKLKASTTPSSVPSPVRRHFPVPRPAARAPTTCAKREACDAAGEREDQAFDEQLPREAPARTAEGGADRHLGFARPGARQEEARDVDAGNDEEQHDGAEQDPQHRTRAANGIGLQLGNSGRTADVATRGPRQPPVSVDNSARACSRVTPGRSRAIETQIVVLPGGVVVIRLQIDRRPDRRRLEPGDRRNAAGRTAATVWTTPPRDKGAALHRRRCPDTPAKSAR